MATKMRTMESEAVIDGFRMRWRLVREQCWCTDHGWRGIAIRVEVQDGRRRELQLEYPLAGVEKTGYTRTDAPRPKVRPIKVEAHIREAIAEGWDPESRGKPYFYEVAELPD